MPSSDIILVTELPTYKMAEGFLQFTIISGDRKRVFRISKHKARSAIHTALRVLSEDDRTPDNVEPIGRRRKS